MTIRRPRWLHPRLIVVAAAIATIPLIYAGMLSWANIDPIGNLHNVPAAIVNNDTAATPQTGSKKTPVNLGTTLTDTLTTSTGDNNFRWTEMTTTEADAALRRGDVYVVLTIPSDFSATAISAANTDPSTAASAKLTVATNDGKNLVIGSVAKSLATTITTSLAAKVSYSTLDAMYLAFSTLHDSVNTAADGARTLADGADNATSGAAELTVGLTKLADGTVTIADGSATLASGASTLATGAAKLSTGTASLASGASSLADGASAASSGASTLASGLSALDSAVNDADGLADGVSSLNAATKSLSSGLSALSSRVGAAGSSDTSTLAGAVAKLASGVGTAQSSGPVSTDPTTLAESTYALKSVSAAVATYCDTTGSSYDATHCSAYLSALTSLSTGIYTAVNEGDTALATALQTLNTSVNTTAVDSSGTPKGLAASVTALSTGAKTLAAGTNGLDTAVNTTAVDSSGNPTGLAASVKKLDAGGTTLATGTATLTTGATKLSTGAATVNTGATTLAAGARSLASGASTLSSGTEDLESGAGKAAAGASTLATGLTSLSAGSGTLASKLADGVDAIPSYSSAEARTAASAAAQPVTLDTEHLNAVPTYGYGLAPYFIALALWVGGIAFYMMFAPVRKTLFERGLPHWLIAVRSILPGATMGIAQGVLVAVTIRFIVGVDAVNFWGLLGIAVLGSVTFVAINQACIALLGAPGRFIALLLMVFQVAAAGGTYPIETAAPFFHFVHDWLPLSYVVNAVRSLIAGGDIGVAAAVPTLSAWLIGSMLVTWLSVISYHKRMQRSGDVESGTFEVEAAPASA